MRTPADPVRYLAHARAKVNLALEILDKRRDGYHEIETIFQSINLFDELDITLHWDDRLEITSTDPDIPVDSRNICHQAVEKMQELAGQPVGAVVHINKQIPHSAGLGGGSSDAAAVMLAVERAAGLRLPRETMEAVAAELGSDVPFMLYGGTMLGQGRGEKLTRLERVRRGVFLIVKPTVDIPTRWAYESYSFRLTRNRYRFNLKAVNAILARVPEVTLTFKNALEDVVCPSYPLVAEVLEELLDARPCYASMTGSGSALFAIFATDARVSELAGRFSLRGFFTAVVEPSSRSVDLVTVDPG